VAPQSNTEQSRSVESRSIRGGRCRPPMIAPSSILDP